MGRKSIDLSGQRYGALVVIERAGTDDKNRQPLWLCECDCGNKTIVRSNGLRSGNTKSCGCGSGFQQKQKNPSYKNGKSKTRLYSIWSAMKTRCYNTRAASYKNYGGRGISVCEEWKNNFSVFYEWSIQNGYKDDLSIDRIDVNGNYHPENCRWATSKQQSCNTRRNIFITIEGETHLLLEWADISGINHYTMLNRYYRSGLRGKDLLRPVKRKKTS